MFSCQKFVLKSGVQISPLLELPGANLANNRLSYAMNDGESHFPKKN